MRLLFTQSLRYRLRSVLLLGFLFMSGLALLIYLIRGQFNLLSVILVLAVGGPVGLLVGALEVYVFPRLLTYRPLWLQLLVSTSLHLLAVGWLLWLGQHLVHALREWVALEASTAHLLDQELLRLGLWPAAAPIAAHSSLPRLLVVYGLLTFSVTTFYQLSRKVGPRSLLRLVVGQYNQPAEERRLFLFVDVKDSTVLAEQLGNIAYSAFIRDFFADVGPPIEASGGEVYQGSH